ncbi:MAG: glycosyltransferase [Flavobacteriales bacterium]|nr:glycosyltransferase [Flavobacteriales bacterium]
MKLSVIIVNYNVRAYLEQCLRTVFKALEGINGEVFVVDNQSTDGSVEMVREKFPLVRLIANAENVGFSRANNQAIRASIGEHVLLLNPDTVVGEDVFRKVLAFLDAHPKAGGLGVRMIDGTGHFLPESKRGLPTPAVAFYKIIGLTRLFPRSRVFGRYHLGHLPEHEAARIEILSGACMFLRRKTLDEVGLLDESFFMYGEDIDLSYRITLGGYENWYYPEARIIHYKGESTKKSSVNYVFVFYNAMAIFAQKHFTRRRTDVLGMLITGSIYLSAAGAIVMRFLRRALLPMTDALMGLAILFGWSLFVGKEGLFMQQLTDLALPFGLSLAVIGMVGGYDLPVRLINVLKATAAIFIGLLLWFRPFGASNFLEDIFQEFEWTIIGLWTGTALVAGLTSRLLLHLLRTKPYSLRTLDRKRVLAIGSPDERKHALALLWQTHFGLGRQKQLDPQDVLADDADQAIRKKIRKHGIDEVVFCAKDLSWARIIALIEGLRHAGVMVKIAQPGIEHIIGPNSVESLHDLDLMEPHAVNGDGARRSKRLFDVVMALALLVGWPVAAWFVADGSGLLSNAWNVLLGRRSWVGYRPGAERSLRLPQLRAGIIDPLPTVASPTAAMTLRANTAYAKDYSPINDLELLVNGFRKLGDQ